VPLSIADLPGRLPSFSAPPRSPGWMGFTEGRLHRGTGTLLRHEGLFTNPVETPGAVLPWSASQAGALFTCPFIDRRSPGALAVFQRAAAVTRMDGLHRGTGTLSPQRAAPGAGMDGLHRGTGTLSTPLERRRRERSGSGEPPRCGPGGSAMARAGERWPAPGSPFPSRPSRRRGERRG